MILESKTSLAGRKTLRGAVARASAVFFAALAPVTFGILAIIFGLIGWFAQLFDGTFHSLLKVVLRALGDFALNPRNFEEGNALTEISSVCGILTLYSSFAVIIASVFREQRRKLLARHVLRKHHLVIGDTALARRVGAIWQRLDRRTLRVAPLDAPQPDFLQRVVRHAYDEQLAHVFAMHRARRVFLDRGDDALTIALALKMLEVVSSGRTRRRQSSAPREWICVVQDDRFAEYFLSEVRSIRLRLDEGLDIPQIILLQPEQLIADELLAASGFARGDACSRAHALVVGYGLLGKHLVDGMLKKAPMLQSPALVTVLTSRPDAHAARMSADGRCAGTGPDVSFLDLAALEDLARSKTHENASLSNRDATVPITAIFLTSDRLHDNILSYIFIQAVRAKLGRLTCQVFSRQGDGEDISRFLPTGLTASKTADFATFGLSDECLEAYLCAPARIIEDEMSTKPIDVVGAQHS